MTDWLWDTGVNETLRSELLPVVRFFEVFTHLGDGTLLVALAITIYWFGAAESRRKRAFVIAVGTAAFALAVGLKGLFQLPRPALGFGPSSYPGYTFPSAHAMGAAAFYGSLAVTMQAGQPWQRYLAAAVLIIVVAVSRVILGLHFLGDVIVGAGLGLLIVWLGLRWRREGTFRPGVVFGLAGIIALVTVFLGSREFAPLAIGTGFGGAAGWLWVADRETSENGAAILVTGASILLGLGILRGVTALLGSPIPGGAGRLVFVGETIAYTVLTALVMIVPALALLIEDSAVVRRVNRLLPFQRRTLELDSLDTES